MSHFKGFTKETISFLINLEMNNSKVWFEANKAAYTEHVLLPMQHLVMDLSHGMLDIDPLFVTAPVVGKTISRIHRDTRFSKDKSPYRSNVWITFKRPSNEWQDCPCFFFEITPEAYRYGMGYYSASRDTMDKLRAVIDHRPLKFYEAISFFDEEQPFTLEGDRYKRNLNSAYDEEILTWYQRKNLYLICNKSLDSKFYQEVLVDDVLSDFKLVKDFYDFLAGL